MEHPDWAARLAAAIEEAVARLSLPGAAQVRSVSATSSDQVEVVYSVPFDTGLRGIRVSADVVRSAPTRISESTMEELAFDVVTTGVFEPRPREDHLPADDDGVRWLSIPLWISEIT